MNGVYSVLVSLLKKKILDLFVNFTCFTFQIGQRTMIFIDDPVLAKRCFKDNGAVFNHRPDLVSFRAIDNRCMIRVKKMKTKFSAWMKEKILLRLSE